VAVKQDVPGVCHGWLQPNRTAAKPSAIISIFLLCSVRCYFRNLSNSFGITATNSSDVAT
jgi:hypothetical protein